MILPILLLIPFAAGVFSALAIRSIAFPMLAANPFEATKELELVQPDFFIKTPADLCRLLKI